MGRVGVISSSEETLQQTLLRELVRDSLFFFFFLSFLPLLIFALYFLHEYHPRLCISTAAEGDATHSHPSSSSHLQPPVMAAGRPTHLVPEGFDACLFLRPQLLLRRRDECGCRGLLSVGITPRWSPEGAGWEGGGGQDSDKCCYWW